MDPSLLQGLTPIIMCGNASTVDHSRAITKKIRECMPDSNVAHISFDHDLYVLEGNCYSNFLPQSGRILLKLVGNPSENEHVEEEISSTPSDEFENTISPRLKTILFSS